MEVLGKAFVSWWDKAADEAVVVTESVIALAVTIQGSRYRKQANSRFDCSRCPPHYSVYNVQKCIRHSL